jgi:hypothetical protein
MQTNTNLIRIKAKRQPTDRRNYRAALTFIRKVQRKSKRYVQTQEMKKNFGT